MRQIAALLVLALAAPAARAEPRVLRLATAAPEGTQWAREAHAFARTVEIGTQGRLRVKWYFGGIAGDEVQMAERVRREQLDGVASGGMLCTRVARSMRVLGVLGLFQSRQEAQYVRARLKPALDDEFARGGFTNLGELGVGAHVLFTREPVRTLAELRHTRVWIWDLDEVMRDTLAAIGVPAVPLPLHEAARAFDDGRLDGFVAVPNAALAFQWSTQARYLTALPVSVLSGCILLANRAFDALSPDEQQVLRLAGAQTTTRIDDVGRDTDEALLGGLFARQGLHPVAVSDTLQSEFLDAAQAARVRLGEKLVPDALMLKVTTWLADYRAEHHTAERH
jgi:TRAP-type C4-dicarboxylate transport system substrate-binding protein